MPARCQMYRAELWDVVFDDGAAHSSQLNVKEKGYKMGRAIRSNWTLHEPQLLLHFGQDPQRLVHVMHLICDIVDERHCRKTHVRQTHVRRSTNPWDFVGIEPK